MRTTFPQCPHHAAQNHRAAPSPLPLLGCHSLRLSRGDPCRTSCRAPTVSLSPARPPASQPLTPCQPLQLARAPRLPATLPASSSRNVLILATSAGSEPALQTRTGTGRSSSPCRGSPRLAKPAVSDAREQHGEARALRLHQEAETGEEVLWAASRAGRQVLELSKAARGSAGLACPRARSASNRESRRHPVTPGGCEAFSVFRDNKRHRPEASGGTSLGHLLACVTAL